MKAKEYAQRYKNAQDKAECIFEIIRDIIIESEQIVKVRHIKRGSSLFDVFDELERKWLAVVRYGEIPLKDEKRVFRFIFKKLMPMFYDDWELHRIKHQVRSESIQR